MGAFLLLAGLAGVAVVGHGVAQKSQTMAAGGQPPPRPVTYAAPIHQSLAAGSAHTAPVGNRADDTLSQVSGYVQTGIGIANKLGIFGHDGMFDAGSAGNTGGLFTSNDMFTDSAQTDAFSGASDGLDELFG